MSWVVPNAMAWCIFCVPCLLTFMQIYETSPGNAQSMDYETCRFVYTSMKRGLAMLEVWNMKIVFVLPVSVRYSVSS